MENPLLGKRANYLIVVLTSIVVVSLAIGIFFIIPESYRPYYTLITSIVFMIDVLFFPSLKNGGLSNDEKRAYPFWILLGILIICESLVFIVFDFSPINARPWLISIVFVSSQLTSYVLYQFLRDRKVIP